MLTGCVQRVFFPEVNAATARVLAADGCEVVAPSTQGCCGALSLHAGREAEAQAFARAAIETFDAAGVDQVVVNAAGCGSAMKEYGHLLRDDPAYAERAKAFSDASGTCPSCWSSSARSPPGTRCRCGWPGTTPATWATPRASAQPRKALRAIPGLEVREIAEGEICCGSAGIYNLVEPEPAAELGDRKAANVLATGADLLVTSNPGCLMQLRDALERRGRRSPWPTSPRSSTPPSPSARAVRGAQPRELLER